LADITVLFPVLLHLCPDSLGRALSRGEAGVEPLEDMGIHVASQVQVDAAVVVESGEDHLEGLWLCLRQSK
jgi:hypothetical protein